MHDYDMAIFEGQDYILSLKVIAGSNGYHGGDAGHGGVTVFRMIDEEGNFEFTPITNSNGECCGFQIKGRGDFEHTAIKEGLLFGYKAIQQGEKNEFRDTRFDSFINNKMHLECSENWKYDHD